MRASCAEDCGAAQLALFMVLLTPPVSLDVVLNYIYIYSSSSFAPKTVLYKLSRSSFSEKHLLFRQTPSTAYYFPYWGSFLSESLMSWVPIATPNYLIYHSNWWKARITVFWWDSWWIVRLRVREGYRFWKKRLTIQPAHSWQKTTASSWRSIHYIKLRPNRTTTLKFKVWPADESFSIDGSVYSEKRFSAIFPELVDSLFFIFLWGGTEYSQQVQMHKKKMWLPYLCSQKSKKNKKHPNLTK